MFEDLTTYLAGAARGEFFAGGLALGLSGGALGLATMIGRRLRAAILRRALVSVTVDNRSAAYRHLFAWLEARGALAHVRQIRATGMWTGGAEVFAPAPGTHRFRIGGRLCLLTRRISERAETGPHHDRRMHETVTLTVLFGSLAAIRGWLAEGARIVAQADRKGPTYLVHRQDWWNPQGQLTGRALDTLVADDDRIERLVADIRRFLAAREWYTTRGVPWRRGYLLYGPPGTGKSSAIRAIATELGLDIAAIEVGRPGLSDDELREAMATAPARAILTLEDVDAVFRAREAGEVKAGDIRAGVSFSGLLNAIDGVAAQEGRALVMTTNHRDRLDPALIRPGRADVQVELGLVGAQAAGRLFARFFPGEAALAARFAQALGSERCSPAALQGWLLAHAEDPATAATAHGLIAPPQTMMAAE